MLQHRHRLPWPVISALALVTSLLAGRPDSTVVVADLGVVLSALTAMLRGCPVTVVAHA